MDSSLKYKDDTDKAYGLVGMAIALVAWDAEEWLESIDLDAAPEEAMHMSADYYLCLSPRIGAKSVWAQQLKRYQLIAAMTVANVVCREMVHQSRQISSAIDTALRSFLLKEGEEMCGLENDEVRSIYNQSYSHCRRLFGHPGVSQLVNDFAGLLIERKTMLSAEVFEALSPLMRM